MTTHRQQVVLGALAANENDADFQPVQVQKLFFLVDQEAAQFVGGKQFNFAAYDFGPFDRAVYEELEALERVGLVSINRQSQFKTYRLTAQGRQVGSNYLANLTASGRDYMKRASEWVSQLGFQEIVSAIYRAYPEMRANSIFRS